MPESSQPRPRFHVEFLRSEFHTRQSKDHRYSLRTFARDLELHHSALSRILNGNQEISLAASHVIVDKLALPLDERAAFISSVAEEKWHKALESFASVIGDASSNGLSQLQEPFEAALRRLSGLEYLPVSSVNLLRSAPFKIYVIDRAGHYLYANYSGLSLSGYKVEEILGKTAKDLGFAEHIVERLVAQQEEVFTTGQNSSIEFVSDLCGEKRLVQRSLSPIRNRKDEIVALFTIVRMVVPGSHNAREYLLRSLFNQFPQALALVDMNLKIVHANEALAEFLGLTAESLHACELSELLSTSWPQLKANFEKVLATSKKLSRVPLVHATTPTGAQRQLSASFFPVIEDAIGFRGVGWLLEESRG